MKLTTGTIVHSTGLLDNTYFENASVMITEYNAEGAVGFVLNKPSGRTLNQLVEFTQSPAFLLHEGGPVDQEHLYLIHKLPEQIPGGVAIGKGLFFGGDFKIALQHIQNHQSCTTDIQLYLGYCGWNAGELEAEINEGSWIISTEN